MDENIKLAILLESEASKLALRATKKRLLARQLVELFAEKERKIANLGSIKVS